MKTIYKLLSISIILCSLFGLETVVIAQEDGATQKDSAQFKSDNYIKKTGYNIAPLPEFMIDPFVGLYLGVYATIFDYGDGERYPNYYRSLNISAAYGTKGKLNLGLNYVSYGQQLFEAKASYTSTLLTPFYGYNGYQTVYKTDFHDNTSEDYITGPFYSFDQKLAQADVLLQDTLKGTFINWMVGVNVRHYSTGRADFSKLNKGVDDEDVMPDVPTLYDQYVAWGIIDEDEKDGGWANSVRAAILYDTRDRLTNPMNGILSGITMRYTPSFLGNPESALQLTLSHQQYFTLIHERLSFAYRLRYDATFGDLGYYSRSVLADGTEGFGGGGTLWGIHQNRIMADQFAMGNFELRAKLFRFNFIKQNFHIAAVPLFHTGYMVDPIDMDLSKVTPEEKELYFNEDYSNWYSSYGLGAKIVMNENVVIGFDWAHAINAEAGGDAFYVGFGYSF